METVEKLSAEEAKSLGERVSVPYRVEDVTVLSPGEWNGLDWTASELKQAVERTDFELSRERGDEQPPNSSLYFNHEDRSADQWIGNVENVRVEGNGDVKTDLVITDKQLAMNLEYGAPFGVSPKADGLIDDNQKMQEFSFENFSMVVNPAVKTTWLNEDIEEVLQDMEIHRPRFNSTTEGEWDSPNLEDFTDKDWSDMSSSEKRAVGRHFLISKSGFPADNYTDLALPVVQPNGALNLGALQNAKARVGQVSGIDESEIARASRIINNLANGNFEDADFEEVDMAGHGKDDEDEDKDMKTHKEEMQETVTHEPEFTGTRDGDWSEPTLSEFINEKGFDAESWSDLTEDQKSSIDNHYIVSKSGFTADKFTDLSLPVVEVDGELNLNALQNAKARAGQVEGLSEDQVDAVKSMIDSLANDNFEDADFGEEMSENEDIKVKTMAEQEQEPEQEPEAEESGEEESVENSDNFVTADELEDFKSEVVESLKQELADGDDEEAEEESEASDEELSEFEEFRQENPDMTLSEAAQEFEKQNRDVEDKIEEMSSKFEERIDELESKLESKEEEVEELSEKVENPQRATQAADGGDGEDIEEKVSNLSDDELHAQIFEQLDSKGGVSATKEMMHNG